MNRPTRNTLFGCGLCLIIASFYSCAAKAQEPSSARKAYDNCVYQSVTAQLEALPVPARRRVDISMMAETAFQACLTEEQVLGLVLANIDRSRALMLLTAVKIQIKRDLQAITANPEAYKTAR